MARESLTSKQARAKLILKRLQKEYPDAGCELNWKTPLELTVATILSAQCTDKRVNIVTPALFKKYKKAKDWAAEKGYDPVFGARPLKRFLQRHIIPAGCAAIREH